MKSAALLLAVAIIHIAHTLLGVGAEGIEQMLLAAYQSSTNS